jgi:hypothetical protein
MFGIHYRLLAVMRNHYSECSFFHPRLQKEDAITVNDGKWKENSPLTAEFMKL